MPELSGSISSNIKVVVIYSDKINYSTELLFSKINTLIKSNKYYESQQYFNLISLINPPSTIKHLYFYFYSFEINKFFYITHKIKQKPKKISYSRNVSSNTINNNIYLMHLLYYVKKMTKYFNNYIKELKKEIKKIIIKIYQFCLILHKDKIFLLNTFT